MKPSRLSRWAATALLALACQDHRPLTSPPSFLIQDAAHSGGNPHVYWLPPMEAQPTFTGTFSGTLSPVIEISELAHEGLSAQRRLQLSDQGVDLRPVAAVSDRGRGRSLERCGVEAGRHRRICAAAGRPYARDQAAD